MSLNKDIKRLRAPWHFSCVLSRGLDVVLRVLEWGPEGPGSTSGGERFIAASAGHESDASCSGSAPPRAPPRAPGATRLRPRRGARHAPGRRAPLTGPGSRAPDSKVRIHRGTRGSHNSGSSRRLTPQKRYVRVKEGMASSDLFLSSGDPGTETRTIASLGVFHCAKSL